jgi:ATP-binding cassette, subfamily A (ABC1), member 3
LIPAGSYIRALFVSLNIFSIICDGTSIDQNPARMTSYGGPILYLIVQAILLFAFLLWYDGGSRPSPIFRRRAHKRPDPEESAAHQDPGVADEVARVESSTDDGLRLLHITKAFGKTLAVQDITFGVTHGEVFALLGPNGAGKSTTISVIRGDIRPSDSAGEVFIENIPLSKKRAAARQHLGVCPQFDAMDQLSVLEHLRFYANIRGVRRVEHNVQQVLRAVGLLPYRSRMANSLSGGNRRKLSLGIALTGNPSVMLLDEVSSGMDVAAKRVMWRTLATLTAHRSILLTTHSMEEADALAHRAGIMSCNMLALGTTESLRRKHGNRYHVHLLLNTAPHTTSQELDAAKAWISANFAAVRFEACAHGQIRFSVPATSHAPTTSEKDAAIAAASLSHADQITATQDDGQAPLQPPGIVALFSKLEASKEGVGYKHYSVGRTTLDRVFLDIVSKHNVQEEGYT